MARTSWIILYFLLCLGMSVTGSERGETGDNEDVGCEEELSSLFPSSQMNASLDYLKPSFQKQTILFPSIQFEFNGYVKWLTIEYFINGYPGRECKSRGNITKNCSEMLKGKEKKSIGVSIWKPTKDGVYTRTGKNSNQKVEGSIKNSNSSERITTAILNMTFHRDDLCGSKHHILGFTLPGLLEDSLVRDILVQQYIPMVLIDDRNSTILEYKKCMTDHGKIVQDCFPVIERGKRPKIITKFVRMEEGGMCGKKSPSSMANPNSVASSDMTITPCTMGLAVTGTLLGILMVVMVVWCLFVVNIARNLRKGRIQIAHDRPNSLPLLINAKSSKPSRLRADESPHEEWHPVQRSQPLSPQELSRLGYATVIDDCSSSGRRKVQRSQPLPPQELSRLGYATVIDDCSSSGRRKGSCEDSYWCPSACETDIYNQMVSKKYVQIPSAAINRHEQLGEGEFGVVYKGQWDLTVGKVLTVALKTLKSTASNDERVKLLQEAAIMGQFKHPHIVGMYGVAITAESVTLVMEYLEKGDLHSYLLELESSTNFDRPACLGDLLRFCQEIVDGMRYLSQKGFIHRDLAARNVLLSAAVECKIADFGMSLDLNEDYYFKPKGGRIPVKWTAPEAIFHKRYTTKSDVWSYGMVMYEIWSLGHKPFEEFTIEGVLGVLHTGYCQDPPPECPIGIYSIMVDCWNPDKDKRPDFLHLMEVLKNEVTNEIQRTSSYDSSITTTVPTDDGDSKNNAQQDPDRYLELQNKYKWK